MGDSAEPYPTEGWDVGWLAVDCDGYLAVFLTGGWGPIPIDALRADALPITDIERLILEMPITSVVALKLSPPDPSSYVELAQRGFFVYDCVDDTLQSGDYTIAAVPETPVGIDVINGALASAAMPRFPNVRFSERASVNVRNEGPCADTRRTQEIWDMHGLK